MLKSWCLHWIASHLVSFEPGDLATSFAAYDAEILFNSFLCLSVDCRDSVMLCRSFVEHNAHHLTRLCVDDAVVPLRLLAMFPMFSDSSIPDSRYAVPGESPSASPLNPLSASVATLQVHDRDNGHDHDRDQCQEQAQSAVRVKDTDVVGSHGFLALAENIRMLKVTNVDIGLSAAWYLYFRNVTSLFIQDSIDDVCVLALVRNLHRLSSLTLRDCSKIGMFGTMALAGSLLCSSSSEGVLSSGLLHFSIAASPLWDDSHTLMLLNRHGKHLLSIEFESINQVSSQSLFSIAEQAPHLQSMSFIGVPIVSATNSQISSLCQTLLGSCLRRLKLVCKSDPRFVTDDVLDSFLCDGSFPLLTALHLQHCTLLTPAAIVRALQRHPKVCDLNLHGCYDMDDHVLSQVLLNARNDGFAKLSLEECVLITGDQVDTAALASCPLADLTSLHLSWCEDISTTAMSSVLASCLHLQSLKLRHCTSLSDAALLSLSSRSLRKLDVARCELLSDKSLCFVVENSPLLEYLDVGWTDFSDRGMRALGFCCPWLRHLCIEGCSGVSSKGMLSLVREGQGCTFLRVLLMDWVSEVHSDGLAAVVAHNLYLRKVCLAFSGVRVVPSSLARPFTEFC
eukprot:ANDGO_04208.mRNA.1 F-box/LRR-repeat protein 4